MLELFVLNLFRVINPLYSLSKAEKFERFWKLGSDFTSSLAEYTLLSGEKLLSVSNRDYYIGDCEDLEANASPVFNF